MSTGRWTGCWNARTTIEAGLAGRHLREGGIAMFDLSSSWVEGSHCELAARGYSRDGKKGREQIEYGLLTDPEGRPVAIRVFAGQHRRPVRVHPGRRRDPGQVRPGPDWSWSATAG